MSGEYEQPDYRSISAESEPWLYRMPRLNHYYGDTVRQFYLGAAALMLLAAPFYTEDLQGILPILLLSAVVLVALAALTNPWKQSVMAANAIAGGVGLVMFELWALTGYNTAPILATGLRQALAILFMFAFYFSMKTYRAMTMHRIGRMGPPRARKEEESEEDEYEKDMDLEDKVARFKEMRRKEEREYGHFND